MREIETLPFNLSILDINDIVTTVPSSMCDVILTTFNSFHPRQFIMEDGDTLNFLDVIIIIRDSFIELGCITNQHFRADTLIMSLIFIAIKRHHNGFDKQSNIIISSKILQKFIDQYFIRETAIR